MGVKTNNSDIEILWGRSRFFWDDRGTIRKHSQQRARRTSKEKSLKNVIERRKTRTDMKVSDCRLIYANQMPRDRNVNHLETCWERRTTFQEASHPRGIAVRPVDAIVNCSDPRQVASSSDHASHVSNSPLQNGSSLLNLWQMNNTNWMSVNLMRIREHYKNKNI